MRFIYLHGFASSPSSRKAKLFIEKMAPYDMRVEALDLAPDFQNLSITSQLSVVETAANHEPVVLIGSSLGGYLAAIYASIHPEVNRLILLAPAFDFRQLWLDRLGPKKLQNWREIGSIPVFHYGMGSEVPLGFQFLEDAANYPVFPDFRQPCLILHGLKDSVVPFVKSAQFASSHSNVRLVALDSGHELTDVLNEIWNTSSTFLLDADLHAA